MTLKSFSIFRALTEHEPLARQAVAEVHGQSPVNEIALAKFLADPAGYLILAVEDDRVIGALTGFALRHPHRTEPQFLLYALDVRPECRSRGIGQDLAAAFTAEARAAGAYEAWTLSNAGNPSAIAAFNAAGFFRENQDDIMLSQPLNQS